MLEDESRRRGMSISQVAGEAITSQLRLGYGGGSLPFANLGRGGRAHTARDMESLLESEWA